MIIIIIIIISSSSSTTTTTTTTIIIIIILRHGAGILLSAGPPPGKAVRPGVPHAAVAAAHAAEPVPGRAAWGARRPRGGREALPPPVGLPLAGLEVGRSRPQQLLQVGVCEPAVDVPVEGEHLARLLGPGLRLGAGAGRGGGLSGGREAVSAVARGQPLEVPCRLHLVVAGILQDLIEVWGQLEADGRLRLRVLPQARQGQGRHDGRRRRWRSGHSPDKIRGSGGGGRSARAGQRVPRRGRRLRRLVRQKPLAEPSGIRHKWLQPHDQQRLGNLGHRRLRRRRLRHRGAIEWLEVSRLLLGLPLEEQVWRDVLQSVEQRGRRNGIGAQIRLQLVDVLPAWRIDNASWQGAMSHMPHAHTHTQNS